ncbi:MAG: DinB family protein [Saprospiraceae bacterium]
MSLAQNLLNELRQEAAVTRKYLERVPFDKIEFKPHEKSETLGRLAIHVAEIIAWWKESIENDELDFIDFEPKDIKSTEELLSYFDDLLIEAEQVLKAAKDEDFEKNWCMRHGEDILFTLPKKQVLRAFCMNHLIHHRAQLGVYLRLLDVPVPATYGPSADDEDVTLIAPYQ